MTLLALLVLGAIDPAAVLQRAGADATRLELVTSEEVSEREPSRRLLEVKDARAIAALLAMIETEPIADPSKRLHHLCVGAPKTRLLRGEQLLAEFSFDHVTYLRPSNELWPGDAIVKPGAARKVAAWYAKQGYGAYAREFAQKDAEAAALEKVRGAFPPQWSAVMRSLEKAQPDEAAWRRIELETPDPVQRVRLICRGFALQANWMLLDFEAQALFALAARIPTKTLVRALDGFKPGSPEALGAQRLLFFPWNEDDSLLLRLPSGDATRLARRDAPAFFAGPWGEQNDRLVVDLGRLDGLDDVLRAEVAKPATEAPAACWSPPPRPLMALAILAMNGSATAALARPLTSRTWTCGPPRSLAKLTEAVLAGRLPTFAEVEELESAVALRFIDWLRARPPNRAEIALGVAMLDHLWAPVAVAAVQWLVTLQGRDAGDVWAQRDELKAWWKTAAASWPERR